jgi:hypothetical protein
MPGCFTLDTRVVLENDVLIAVSELLNAKVPGVHRFGLKVQLCRSANRRPRSSFQRVSINCYANINTFLTPIAVVSVFTKQLHAINGQYYNNEYKDNANSPLE